LTPPVQRKNPLKQNKAAKDLKERITEINALVTKSFQPPYTKGLDSYHTLRHCIYFWNLSIEYDCTT